MAVTHRPSAPGRVRRQQVLRRLNSLGNAPNHEDRPDDDFALLPDSTRNIVDQRLLVTAAMYSLVDSVHGHRPKQENV